MGNKTLFDPVIMQTQNFCCEVVVLAPKSKTFFSVFEDPNLESSQLSSSLCQAIEGRC